MIRIMSIMLCMITFFCEAKELHVLLLADTLTDMKVSSFKDLKHMKKAMKTIAGATRMPLHITKIYGKELTKERVTTWIRQAPIHNDDVFVVYYTGHGLRTKKTTTIWPSPYFAYNDEIIAIQDLITTITSKPATFHLILIDCCNNYIEDEITKSFGRPPYKSKGKRHKENYKKLFSDPRGVIIASGAIPGKKAWCTEKGSIFTSALLDCIEKEISASQPQWPHILAKTKALCEDLQEPQYELFLEN